MNDSDLDPDPRRRVPTSLWLMLAVVLIVLFAAVVIILGGHVSPRSLGPPAGSP